jgi:hypothetical protein
MTFPRAMRVHRPIAALACLTVAFAAAPSRDALQAALQARYQITTNTNSPGTVLTIQQAGINAFPIGTLIIPDTKVEKGKVKPPGFMGEMLKTPYVRGLNAGEKVYISKIEAKNDQVKVSLATCDVYDVDYNGTIQQKRYLAVLTFRFPKEYLDKATPADVEQAIEAILAPDAAMQQPAATAPATPEPPSTPPTVSLGQTIDQVVAALGPPEKIIDLGAKKTYLYKDLKVIFLDGKVSDVQ